jgi:hypothetical protein
MFQASESYNLIIALYGCYHGNSNASYGDLSHVEHLSCLATSTFENTPECV